ncbi:MAG: hypothetical protein HS105_12920 [Chloracidobacterium sp.]|nr:hypothetical protein [Chloracidobacterium sp.]
MRLNLSEYALQQKSALLWHIERYTLLERFPLKNGGLALHYVENRNVVGVPGRTLGRSRAESGFSSASAYIGLQISRFGLGNLK